MNTLKVGAAKRHISPADDMFPLPNFSGFYEAQRPGEELTVRAIVIDNGERLYLFEAWELADVPFDPWIREELHRQYGISPENMLLSATHDHSAPFVDKGPVGVRDEALSERMADNVRRYAENIRVQSLAVVGDAVANLREARWGFGEGKSYINVNRDQHFFEGYWMQGANWEGPSDKTLAVMKFTDPKGNLIAAILNYPMHSTTSMCAKDTDGLVKVTCDAPGIAANFVEDYYGGGAVCLWQSSSNGDQNPKFVALKPCYDRKGNLRNRLRVPGASYEEGIVMGQQQGIDALETLERIDARRETMRIRTAEKMIELEGQRFPEGVDPGAHRLMVDNLQEWAGLIGPDDPMPEKHLADMIPTGEPVLMRAHLTILGDVAFFAVSGETYNATQFKLKAASPLKKLVVVNIIGKPFVSYVLDDDSKDHKVFQSYMQVRPGDSDRRIIEGMEELFRELL